MFKFIHTSDWHLGQNFYNYDRSEEQRDMLRQLADIARKPTPDALLVSGDIFHTAAPSNAAMNMYVEEMLNIRRACPTMDIIVIAGNHDSASRLDCDRLLWEKAGVMVKGGIARDTSGHAALDSHIVPVGDKGIVAAVPFAFPSNFPLVDGTDTGREERQRAYFQAVLDLANANNHNGVPVVLMAHLAVSHSDFTGHDMSLMMDSVDITTLGEGYDYVALGHIHRPQQLTDRVRYCGTPLPVSFDEQCEHSVSIVEIDSHGDKPRIETKRIKNIKPLHTLPAGEAVPLDSALELLQQFDPTEQAYLRLNVQVETFLPHWAQEQAMQAVQDKACRLCEIKKTATVVEHRQARPLTVDELSKMQPIDVADRYYRDKAKRPMNEQEREMFNYVYQLIQQEDQQ